MDILRVEAGIEEVGAVGDDSGFAEAGASVVDAVARQHEEVHPVAVTAHVREPFFEHHIEPDVHLVVARHEPTGDHAVATGRGVERLEGMSAGMHAPRICRDAIAGAIGNLGPLAEAAALEVVLQNDRVGRSRLRARGGLALEHQGGEPEGQQRQRGSR